MVLWCLNFIRKKLRAARYKIKDNQSSYDELLHVRQQRACYQALPSCSITGISANDNKSNFNQLKQYFSVLRFVKKKH